MIIHFHKRFQKQFAKLPQKVKIQAKKRLVVFAQDPLDPILRVHALSGSYKGSFSIDVTGDYRAIYNLVDDQTTLFTHIGTHSQLY